MKTAHTDPDVHASPPVPPLPAHTAGNKYDR